MTRAGYGVRAVSIAAEAKDVLRIGSRT
jgi:hypothetical protein